MRFYETGGGYLKNMITETTGGARKNFTPKCEPGYRTGTRI